MRDINNTDTKENETKRKKTMNRILINLAQLTRLQKVGIRTRYAVELLGGVVVDGDGPVVRGIQHLPRTACEAVDGHQHGGSHRNLLLAVQHAPEDWIFGMNSLVGLWTSL